MIGREPARPVPIVQAPVDVAKPPIDKPPPVPIPIDVGKDIGIGPPPIEPRKDFDDKGDIVRKDDKKIDDPIPKLPPPPPPPPPAVPMIATFVPPNPAALALKPSNLEADRVTRMLPGTIDDIAVGGGGRFPAVQLAAAKDRHV